MILNILKCFVNLNIFKMGDNDIQRLNVYGSSGTVQKYLDNVHSENIRSIDNKYQLNRLKENNNYELNRLKENNRDAERRKQ